MKTKNNILLTILIVVALAIIVAICYFGYKLYSNRNTQLSDNEYIITTDFRWKTMMNDGGSNTSIYYKFNFNNNTVVKEQTNYNANLGGTPTTKTTTIYTKEMSASIQKEAMSLINELITKEDTNPTNNYNSFTISSSNIDKIIYNVTTIETINTLLNKIDKI